jgi:DnaK suppressor protein
MSVGSLADSVKPSARIHPFAPDGLTSNVTWQQRSTGMRLAAILNIPGGFDLDRTFYCTFKTYGGIMDERFVRSTSDRLQRERRALIDELSRREEQSETFAGDLQPELEEHAQTEVASGITEALRERQQDRLGNIDEALARIEAGTYGDCQNCGRPIGEERLEVNAITIFCKDCASEEEVDAAGQAEESAEKRVRPADHCHLTLS